MFNLNNSLKALVKPHPGQGILINFLKMQGVSHNTNTKKINPIKKINMYNLFFLIN